MDLSLSDHISKVKCFTDVIYSMIGTVVWAVILIAWIVTFQLNRSSWGDFADDISFIIPLGTS